MNKKSFYHPTSADHSRGYSIVKTLRTRHKAPAPVSSVTKFEIIRQLKKPSFWIALLLMPACIVGIVIFSAFSGYSAGSTLPSVDYSDQTIGIVDESGIFAEDYTLSTEDTTSSSTLNVENSTSASEFSPSQNSEATYTYQTYSSPSAALAALRSGEIALIYILPSDFPATPATSYRLADYSALFDAGDQPLRSILLVHTSAHISETDVTILTNNYTVDAITIDETGENVNLLGRAIIPIAILIVFYIMVCVFGNRFLMTVVEEKENRISEMILTSVSARHLIIGKLIALVVLVLIQLAVLIIPAVLLLFIYRDNPVITSALASVQWDPLMILANIVLFFASLFLFAGLCTLIGSLVPTAREASQYIGPVMICMMLPLFFLNSFLGAEPNISTFILTYFPLSAPMSLMIRSSVGGLPWWEFAIGLAELIILAVVVIHLTVKTFQKNAINFSVRRPKFAARKRWKV